MGREGGREGVITSAATLITIVVVVAVPVTQFDSRIPAPTHTNKRSPPTFP
jgi:hypothetical protein